MVGSPASRRVVVVGAGHAGGAFALALRDRGHDGSIVLIGEEPHHPYERPSLSKAALNDPDAEPVHLAEARRWSADFDVKLAAEATAIDRVARAVRLADGSSVQYDVLVLATGGRARELPFPAHPRMHDLRTIEDSRRIRASAECEESAVIVGGGVIGLEVAASLRSRGLSVTVVEAGPRLLGRNVPQEAAAWLEALHRAQGVGFRLGETVASVAEVDGRLAVGLSVGERLLCGLVVVGIGISPRTEIARAAGLPCRDGVLVDREYRSIADPLVFAIGDVAARAATVDASPVRRETWAHAQTSARVAAAAVMEDPPEPDEIPWFWTEQFGHTLQVAGSPGDGEEVVARGTSVRLYLRAGRVVGSACLDAARDFAVTRRLIASGARLDRDRSSDPSTDLRKAVAA